MHLDDYLVLAFFTGSGAAIDRQTTGSDVLHSAGLIFLLVLFAVVVLLFTGRYPVGIFDLVLGPESVGSSRRGHAALMTDRHPPFSLDLGPSEPEVPTATQIAL